MQPREKVLASIVGALLVLLVVYWGVGKVRAAFNERNNRIEILEGEIRERLALEQRGKLAAQQLAHWEHRSLPSDTELARTLYQNWLVSLADKHKLEGNVTVDAGRGGMHRNIYYKLPFTIQGKGSLEQLTALLYDFYSANHLHQLREMSIKPSSSSRTLDLSLTIEALVLPGADRNDALNDERGSALSGTTASVYRDPIVKRNLFADYIPPRPPAPIVTREPDPPAPPAFDPSRFAVLTAILEVGNEAEAWINVRTTGEVLRLRQGDKLKVGPFEGTVARIHPTSVELECDGKRRLLALGKTLPQAAEATYDGAQE